MNLNEDVNYNKDNANTNVNASESINEFNSFIEHTLNKYKSNIDSYENKNESISKAIEANGVGEYVSELQNQIAKLTIEITNITNYNKELSLHITKLNTQLQSKDQNIIELNNKLNDIKELYRKNETELQFQYDAYKGIIDSFITSQQETLHLFSMAKTEISPAKPLLYLSNQLNAISQFIDTIISDNKNLIEQNEQNKMKIEQYEAKLHTVDEQFTQMISEKEQQIQALMTSSQNDVEQYQYQHHVNNDTALLKQTIDAMNNDTDRASGSSGVIKKRYKIVNECDIGYGLDNKLMKIEVNEDDGDKEYQKRITPQKEYNIKNSNDISGCSYGKNNIRDNDDVKGFVNLNKNKIRQPLENLRNKIEMLEKMFKEQESSNEYINDPIPIDTNMI